MDTLQAGFHHDFPLLVRKFLSVIICVGQYIIAFCAVLYFTLLIYSFAQRCLEHLGWAPQVAIKAVWYSTFSHLWSTPGYKYMLIVIRKVTHTKSCLWLQSGIISLMRRFSNIIKFNSECGAQKTDDSLSAYIAFKLHSKYFSFTRELRFQHRTKDRGLVVSYGDHEMPI